MKLSTLLAILTIGQFFYITFNHFGWYIQTNFPFDILHENTIFIMHLMTWFIVKSIENKKV